MDISTPLFPFSARIRGCISGVPFSPAKFEHNCNCGAGGRYCPSRNAGREFISKQTRLADEQVGADKSRTTSLKPNRKNEQADSAAFCYPFQTFVYLNRN